MAIATKTSSANIVPFDAPLNWGNPDTSLLRSTRDDRPAFPTGLLGAFWSPWVEAVAKSKNTPVDYVGAGLITTAAALIGNARMAAGPGGWTEPAILWTVLVGHSSGGKSPALDTFVDIIGDIEEEAARALDDEDSWDGTFSIDDATAQAVAEVAAKSPKGLFMAKDELSDWWKTLGRNEGFWNQSYGARPTKVARKSKPKLFIKRLALTILGGAQPKTLEKFILTDNTGFSARWLYVFPKPVEGYQAACPVDVELARERLKRLWNLGLAEGAPVAVRLTQQAAPRFEAWVDQTRRVAHEDEEGVWGQWNGKQGGVALRLALIFEYLWWLEKMPGKDEAGPTRIGIPAIKAAMAFIDTYSSPMAALTLGEVVRPVEEQDALRLLRMLKTKGAGQFNARLLGRGESHGKAGSLSQPDAMAKACAVLAAARLIRHVGERADGKPGRRPSIYEVNPVLLGTAAVNGTRKGAGR